MFFSGFTLTRVAVSKPDKVKCLTVVNSIMYTVSVTNFVYCNRVFKRSMSLSNETESCVKYLKRGSLSKFR